MEMFDTSIYKNIPQTTFADSFGKGLEQGAAYGKAVQESQERGMKLSQMAREQQDAIRTQNFNNQLKDSYTQDPTTGRLVLDTSKLSDLAKIDGPRAIAAQQANQADQLQQATVANQRAQMIQDKISQAVGTAVDQSSYTRAIQWLSGQGIDTSKVPPNFDPKYKSQMMQLAASAQQQIDNHAKEFGIQTDRMKAQAAMSEVGIKSQDLALQRQKLYGGSGTLPGPGGKVSPDTDPSLLVPGMVPEHHQAKALTEIEAAQNTQQNAGKILNAFDNAANKLHAVDFVPGVPNADQKQLHALMGPTFKDVEGTVRQAAMDNMNENTTPQFGDSKATLAKKRAALVGYLQSKASAPTAKAYGIDLRKYKSTALTDQSMGQKPAVQPHPQDSAALSWAKANPKDPRAAKILQLNGAQ